MLKDLRRYCHGFTLVELSIVIIIIGLIVGGTFVGKDLLEASKLHAQVSELSKYSLATNTFIDTYNALPGDMLNADRFGLPYIPTSLTNRGDGIINTSASSATPVNLLHAESYMFFSHLSSAGFIGESYMRQNSTYSYCDAAGYLKQFPKLKIGQGGIYAATYEGKIWYGLMLNNCSLGTNQGNVNQLSTGGVLTPLNASQLDQKIDDGIPATGKVRAVKSHLALIDDVANQCVVDSSSNAYNITDNALRCRLFIKAK